jgi:hypothetical protein
MSRSVHLEGWLHIQQRFGEIEIRYLNLKAREILRRASDSSRIKIAHCAKNTGWIYRASTLPNPTQIRHFLDGITSMHKQVNKCGGIKCKQIRT